MSLNYTVQRKESVHYVKTEIARVLTWENPVRSAFILASFLIGIRLTCRHSWLYLIASMLTIIIGANLIIVVGGNYCVKRLTASSLVNPYRNILKDKCERPLIDKDAVLLYSSMSVDIADFVIQALVRVVCVENTKASVKWLIFSMLTLQMTRFISSEAILTLFIGAAFLLPRIYINKRAFIDTRMEQAHGLLNARLHKYSGC